jgi:hypothetical protein
MRSVEQSTRVAKAKRRLPPTGQLALDEEVKRLIENPLVGEAKVGAIAHSAACRIPVPLL